MAACSPLVPSTSRSGGPTGQCWPGSIGAACPPGLGLRPDGHSLSLGDENGGLVLCDTSGAILASTHHDGGIMHLAFSGDGSLIAVGDGDLELRPVADLTQRPTVIASAQCCSPVARPGRSGRPTAVASPAGPTQCCGTERRGSSRCARGRRADPRRPPRRPRAITASPPGSHRPMWRT